MKNTGIRSIFVSNYFLSQQTKNEIMKILAYLIGFLVVAYLLLCFLGPKEISAERSIEIAAPAAAVYNNVADFKKWSAWMPWYQKDPNMKMTFGEKHAGIGGNYTWESESQGNGSMEIIEAEPNTSLKTKIDFDGQGGAYGSWQFEPAADGKTKTTWSLQGDEGVGFFSRGILYLIGMQQTLDEDFENGLKNLKKTVEDRQANLPTTYNGLEVKTVDVPAQTYLGFRKKMPWSEMTGFYAASFPAAFAGAAAQNLEVTGKPFGLFYEWDTVNQMTDMAAVVPLQTAPSVAPEGMTVIQIPGGKAAQIDYYGPYAETGKAHEALEKYVTDRGLKLQNPVTEQYLNDPQEVKDSTEILTRVTYLYE